MKRNCMPAFPENNCGAPGLGYPLDQTTKGNLGLQHTTSKNLKYMCNLITRLENNLVIRFFFSIFLVFRLNTQALVAQPKTSSKFDL